MQYTVETPRLGLRPMTTADTGALYEILGDREVCRWQTFAPFTSLELVRECIEVMNEEIAECAASGEELRFGIELKSARRLIGEIGAEYDSARRAHELGCSLNRLFWCRGYAPEAAMALFKYAREKYGIRDYFALIADKNTASRGVAASCGFKRERAAAFSNADDTILKAAYYTLHLK